MLATFMLRRREGMAASNYREVLGDKLFRSVCILADVTRYRRIQSKVTF